MKVICPHCKKELSITALTRHTRIFHADVKKITITIERTHTESNRNLQGQNLTYSPLYDKSNFNTRN